MNIPEVRGARISLNGRHVSAELLDILSEVRRGVDVRRVARTSMRRHATAWLHCARKARTCAGIDVSAWLDLAVTYLEAAVILREFSKGGAA